MENLLVRDPAPQLVDHDAVAADISSAAEMKLASFTTNDITLDGHEVSLVLGMPSLAFCAASCAAGADNVAVRCGSTGQAPEEEGSSVSFRARLEKSDLRPMTLTTKKRKADS